MLEDVWVGVRAVKKGAKLDPVCLRVGAESERCFIGGGEPECSMQKDRETAGAPVHMSTTSVNSGLQELKGCQRRRLEEQQADQQLANPVWRRIQSLLHGKKLGKNRNARVICRENAGSHHQAS
eukprot:TRINITY_DN52465_c0_g1_i1.p3 TRINITY_DN52465_c0_g1~~TRINITY_DN52465_c0_g1_i1.p3  ORF type:complete len:124 (+),score=6.45 TRINITY_DN52465_c0_g1_i1:22-393(+)